jgi:hypothetical protein
VIPKGPVVAGDEVGFGSVAPIRSLEKLPLASHIVLSSTEVLSDSNVVRATPLVLADKRRRLHFVSGRSECRVKSARKAGHGRLPVLRQHERTTGVGDIAAIATRPSVSRSTRGTKIETPECPVPLVSPGTCLRQAPPP